MNPDEKHATAAVVAGKCDGDCAEHRGEVKLVTVGGWGYFAYCETAVEEDKSRGLVVEPA